MKKIRIFCFLTAFIFITSTQALNAKEESQATAGPADPAETGAALLGSFEDDRISDLKNQYRTEIDEITFKIKNETDPLKREELQKEIHNIKAEREIEVLELRFDIAVEEGDSGEADQLQKILDQAYLKTNTAQTKGTIEKQQQPENNNKKIKTRKKNPDDM